MKKIRIIKKDLILIQLSLKLYNLIKKIQKECYIEKEITEEEYKEALMRYQKKIVKIKEKIPILKDKIFEVRKIWKQQ